jgi:uncharacterized glyoxalase superfamily protein PhnB
MATRKKRARKVARKPARKSPRPGARAAAGTAAQRTRRRQPETLRLREIVPSFTVNDVNASMAWYRDVLGCIVEETWMHEGAVAGAMVRAGTVRILLNQDDWKKGHDRRKGEGVRLFCTTVQDVDALAEQVKARGGRLSHEPQDQPWGVRDFGLADPDGYNITIQAGR